MHGVLGKYFVSKKKIPQHKHMLRIEYASSFAIVSDRHGLDIFGNYYGLIIFSNALAVAIDDYFLTNGKIFQLTIKDAQLTIYM